MTKKKINESLPKKHRKGQVGINNQGLEMIIEKYNGCHDINVKFIIDGYLAKNKQYDKFLDGGINNPNFPNSKFIDRTGERRQNNQGDWMEIVECFGCDNNTVRFDDDGSIVKGVSYSNFKRGVVGHPIRFTESLLYLYPKVAEAIAIPENKLTLDDCSKIRPYSNEPYFVKCPNCKKISKNKLRINQLTNYGIPCKYCSDYISIPNKMLRQIAKQLSLNWEFEYSEDWMGNHKFDAYDLDLKQPIEADAWFRINDNHKGKRKEIDNWKDNQAIEHDMKLPIRIDLMDTKEYDNNKLEYIKQQIYLAIGDLYDLDKVDWELAFINAQKSLMIEACRLWREEHIYSTVEIGKILKLARTTIVRYLNRGYKLGLCDYTVEKSHKERGKRKSSINGYQSILYWVIKSDGEKYNDKPLCGNEIYNDHSSGFLNIGKPVFDKYIKPYGNIDISRITSKNYKAQQTKLNLTPFDGWQFIPLSKEEKQQYLESINNQQPQ